MSSATVSSGTTRVIRDEIEEPRVRIGFLPLTDSAPIIVAKERGFFRKHGLHVSLCREPSWSNVRDKLTAGVLDGAALLAPMALAADIGAPGFSTPLVTALSLDLNGNAITVSPELFRLMADLDTDGMRSRPHSALPLRRVIEKRRRDGMRRLTLAVVFPFSTHAYELRYWLAAAGIDPERDVSILVASPPTMVGLLRSGSIDGFCVGEPWSSYAAQLGWGRVVVSKYEIWNNSPEKVFAVTSEWHERHPGTHAALVRALIEAGQWLDVEKNRLEAVHIIAGESFVDAPVEAVQRSMLGPFSYGEGEEVVVADFHVFYRYAATFPWRSQALWLLGQMWRWGQLDRPCDLRAIAERVYLTDFYREAAVPLDIEIPRSDSKSEGTHREPWSLEDASRPLAMGPDAFIDEREFHPERIRDYLAEQTVGSPRIPLAALRL
jgi:nitrate/nitrite transport system substrate-binding protein